MGHLQASGLHELAKHAADVAGLAGVGLEVEPLVVNGLRPDTALFTKQWPTAARKEIDRVHWGSYGRRVQSRQPYQAGSYLHGPKSQSLAWA